MTKTTDVTSRLKRLQELMSAEACDALDNDMDPIVTTAAMHGIQNGLECAMRLIGGECCDLDDESLAHSVFGGTVISTASVLLATSAAGDPEEAKRILDGMVKEMVG